MPFKVEHNYRFDSAGKLDADDWVMIPRGQLAAGFALDSALADTMVRRYFEILKSTSPVPIAVVSDPQGIRLLAPLGKTAMHFAEPERVVDARRAETSWQIAGGFMLAHRVSYGGRFYVGAEWDKSQDLKLYSTIRRYPPRLTNWFGIRFGIAVYQRTQGPFHQQIQAKFLSETAGRLAGASK